MSASLQKNLSDLLKKKGISLAGLAKKSAVPKSTLHGWVSGQAAVNLEQLQSVAEALGVGVHLLAYGTPDPFEEVSTEVLKEIFSGDVRVTLHRIERKK
jgi:transcriptional regulator with XRE-family HTH domain